MALEVCWVLRRAWSFWDWLCLMDFESWDIWRLAEESYSSNTSTTPFATLPSSTNAFILSLASFSYSSTPGRSSTAKTVLFSLSSYARAWRAALGEGVDSAQVTSSWLVGRVRVWL